ncbi:hypothetical protein [Paenibacillus lentus]|uniref:Uncharacterized protein n=1 Tax=Paenibacillus lentus TaxID=1338368 RepID=A0A3S8RZX2_9BACL|nr:hypothetical protein [Paenibacillus lentus]AZK48447.1 hypothetical protein EIM92_21600 [Paenibacillus lentus]
MNGSKSVMPMLAALLAAIIGGAIWALIVVLTEYEVGIVAWAIGGLAAFAVSFFAKKITPVHQVLAVVASLLGILLGKYFIYSYLLIGEAAGIMAMFHIEVIRMFPQFISALFGGMDIIFVLLAIVTAWQLPVKLASNRSEAEEGVSTE